MRDYVTSLTSSGHFEDGMPGHGNKEYSIHRDDPVVAMDKWRQRSVQQVDVDINAVSLIDKHCSHLYPLLGYRTAESQQDLKSNKTFTMPPSSENGVF